jgi:hypothetical protein
VTIPTTVIPDVPQGTLDPAAGLNAALRPIRILCQALVTEIGVNAPPGSPSDGDCVIVGVGTGDFTGQDDNLACYVEEGDFWQFIEAGVGVWMVLNLEDGGLYTYNPTTASSGWVLAAGLSDAPSNGQIYGRRDGVWEAFAITAPPVVNTASANIDADENNAGNYTRFSHAAPTYTFDDATPYVLGAEYHGRYVGSGSLMIVATSGMTINPPANGTLEIPPDGTFTVKIVAADEADLFGITVAA